jgi:hypothetical protein
MKILLLFDEQKILFHSYISCDDLKEWKLKRNENLEKKASRKESKTLSFFCFEIKPDKNIVFVIYKLLILSFAFIN